MQKKNYPSWFLVAMHVVIPVTLTFLLFVVTTFFLVLPAYKARMMDSKKELIRELTNTMWAFLDHYRERVDSGELTLQESQKRAVLRMRALRYGPEKKDYFWINDLSPTLIMHPYRAELEGSDLNNYKDAGGNFLFRDFVRVAKERGEGYVRYLWQWQDDESYIGEKLSYVRLYEPWGWIVGTGVYIHDVEAEIGRMTSHLIKIFLLILVVVFFISLYVIIQGARVERKQQETEAELTRLKNNLEIEVKTKTQALIDTQQQLITSERLAAMGQLGATIAHEFRNQLGVMKNAAYYIRKKIGEFPDQKVQKHIRILEEEITRTDEIIHDILTFARAKEPTKHSIDVRLLVASVRRKIDIDRNKKIQFTFAISDDLIEICADEIQLSQILVNLLRNAIEAVNDDNGVVSLAVDHVEDAVRFCIKDNGVGMTAQVKEHLFDPLFTTKARGTGLGLATVKMLVERHGGTIKVESVEGKGTDVCVLIPKTCASH